MEEATYISLETFREIIAPLMGPSNVCLIGLSTLGASPTNFFTRLIRSGKFSVQEVSYICKPCQQKGVTTTCPHNADAVPHWSGESRVDLIRDILGEGSEEQFMRESLGVIKDDADDENGRLCFGKSKVLELISNARIKFENIIRFVYICIDPCAGSDNEAKAMSDFAVVTMSGPGRTILGMEAIKVIREEDFEHRLIEHIRRVRTIKMCEKAKIVLDIESGTGLEASRVNKLVRSHFDDVITMTDFIRKDGTKTDEAAKRDMVTITREALEAGDVSIHEDFVTTHSDPKKLMQEFGDQMMEYSRVINQGNGRRAPTVTFTGKTKQGKKDDLAMTFQRCIRAMRRFATSPKYDRWRV
jgi:hypothetical protein